MFLLSRAHHDKCARVLANYSTESFFVRLSKPFCLFFTKFELLQISGQWGACSLFWVSADLMLLFSAHVTLYHHPPKSHHQYHLFADILFGTSMKYIYKTHRACKRSPTYHISVSIVLDIVHKRSLLKMNGIRVVPATFWVHKTFIQLFGACYKLETGCRQRVTQAWQAGTHTHRHAQSLGNRLLKYHHPRFRDRWMNLCYTKTENRNQDPLLDSQRLQVICTIKIFKTYESLIHQSFAKWSKVNSFFSFDRAVL